MEIGLGEVAINIGMATSPYFLPVNRGDLSKSLSMGGPEGSVKLDCSL